MKGIFLFSLVNLIALNFVSGLYEDQIKKFDWKRTQIGHVNNAFLDLNGYNQNRLIVSTEENVIASLDPKSGALQWRQVLENSPRGDLKLIQMLNDGVTQKNALRQQSAKSSYDILTVQGHSPAIVRGWNALNGHLEFEWSLMPLQTDKAIYSFWFSGSNLNLYHVIPSFGSHLEVTEYVATNGNSKGITSKISAPWIQKDKCVVSGTFYICLEGTQLLGIDLTSENPQVQKKILQSSFNGKIKTVRGLPGAVVLDGSVYSFSENEKLCETKILGQTIMKAFNGEENVLIESKLENNVLEISLKSTKSCQLLDIKSTLNYPNHYGAPEILAFNCGSNGKTCSFVLSTQDEALLYVQGDKIRWAREEALANVVAGEFIDLPVSDSDGTIEDELKSKPGDFLDAFSRRFISQIHLTKSIFLHVLGLGPAPSETQKAGLIRDAFGLHKMLVILTKAGKVFGVDNINGKIHWMYYIPYVENFNNGEEMKLVVQRSAKHFPKQPICTIVTKDSKTKNGVLFSFNPITGLPIGEITYLNYEIQQIALLNEDSKEFIKAILLLDNSNQVRVIPENLKEQADGLYLYTAQKKSAILKGFYVKYNEKLQTLNTKPIWKVNLSGHGSTQEITSITAKNPLEHVHSQGRVLNDRSVLYKYINPNLIAVVTQGTDIVHKYVMNVHLVDVVSGSVVFSLTHKKVRGPVNIVHSENWLAYSYFNDKVRRTEITAIELYEGKVQANSSVWSSLDAPPIPLVERQSYILPFSVEFLKETITERGITNKHVLIATSSGNIMEMPWFYLDPRRPIIQPNQPREEGVLPYIPELPFIQENMINYNQTVAKIRGIFTSPSGLESTCLVLATGLDLFVTRVSPSKTFDLLKEDFDYYLIAMVLVALTSASLFVKQLSARKILKQAWK